MSNSNMGRRSFLKGAAVAAAGVPYFVSSSAFGKDRPPPSERITIGCIGVGGRGTGNMQTFLRKDEAQVVAVCDVDKRHSDRAKQITDKHYGNKDCETYKDFRKMLEQEDLDAVSIAVPDHWHALPAIAAARAGLDIYAEKPLARSIREGRAMCQAVHRAGVVWQTGCQQRSTGNFRRACELVRNGHIGEIEKVEVGLPHGSTTGNHPPEPVPPELDWEFWLGPAPFAPYHHLRCHWNWRWILDYSGGQLTDWAGHHIDIAHWGLGRSRTGPVEIEGEGTYPEDGLWNTPYAYRFTCKYKEGPAIIVADNQQFDQGVRWYGEDGWIYVRRGVLKANPSSVLDATIGADETHLYKSNDHKQNFLDCVKTREETVAPIEVGHRSISVGLLGEIAMLTERKIRWDPEREKIIGDPQASSLLCRSYREPWQLPLSGRIEG